MPLYEYRCGACGHEFEDFRTMSEADADDKCPACGKNKVGRLVSRVSSCGSSKSSEGGSCGTSTGPFR